MRGTLILALLLEAACSKQRVPDERVAKVVYVDVKPDAGNAVLTAKPDGATVRPPRAAPDAGL